MGHTRGATSRALVAVAALAVTVGAARAAEAQERRVATLAPPGSSWMKVLRRGAQEIEKRTDGRVSTKFYPGGVQGDERDVVRKIKLGQLDGAALTSVGLSLIDESIRVLELPMLFDSIDELDYVRGKMWPYFQKKFAKKGFVLSDPGDVGFIHFLSQAPVRSMSDLRKAKVWLWTDDRVVRAMYKKLGINGVPLGVPDVLPALQTGRIDACYTSPLAAVALQWYTKTEHISSMPMSYAIGASVMRKEVWDEANGRDQKIIAKIEEIVRSKLLKVVRKDNKRAFKAIKSSGVELTKTPQPMVRRFEKAAAEVWHELAGELYSKKELQMVLNYREQYRKTH